MLHRRTRVASSALLGLFSAAAFAALMQHSETTIPVPAPNDEVQVVVRWEFSGSKTDGQAHRVEIAVRLLDESGAQVGFASTRSIQAAGARGRAVVVTTKVKADAWKAAKKARIFADWMS